jgi:two-component system, NarL family, invasion response regulator UvrY
MRILIIDDHPIVISGCRALLASDPGVEVFEASDGETGYSTYFAHRPNVTIVDLNLPGLSGLELMRRILQPEPWAKIIMFTMNDDPAVAARAIAAGAKGYITKNDDPALLLHAVKSVAQGGVYLRPEMASEIAFLRAGANATKISDLSPRELEILRLMAAGRTVAEIAKLFDLSWKTIANHRSELKHKLGARSAMDLMRIALDAKL